jgi:hypothetical protein
LWMFTVGRYEKFPGLANNPAGMESKSSVMSAGKAKANRKEPPLRQQHRPPQGPGRAACMDSSPVVRPSNACSAPPSRSPRSGTFQKISPRFFLTSCVHPVSCKPSFGSAIGAGPVACSGAWSAFCLSAPVIGSLETASAGPDFGLNRHS